MEALWQFAAANKEMLTWLGGGVVIDAGGIWTVAKFLLDRKKSGPASAVSGVAAGRDIRGSPITITHGAKPDGRPGPS